MSDDDIFGDSDRTVIKPMPGGRPGNQAPPPGQPAPPPPIQPPPAPPVAGQPAPVQTPPPQAAPMQAAPQVDASPANLSSIRGSRLNPLVDAATNLFFLVGQLRQTMNASDVDHLRNSVMHLIQTFESQAATGGVKPEHILTSKYAICCLIDEVVLNTPWGSESSWATQSMLNTFHKEAWGGEKFFQILDRLAQEPAVNLDNLHFFYICLSLGFEGKFRISERGQAELTAVKENLYRTIQNFGGDFERELSPRWRSDVPKSNVLVKYVPLWVVAAAGATLLLALYLGFKILSETSSSDLREGLDAIEAPAAETTQIQ